MDDANTTPEPHVDARNVLADFRLLSKLRIHLRLLFRSKLLLGALLRSQRRPKLLLPLEGVVVLRVLADDLRVLLLG